MISARPLSGAFLYVCKGIEFHFGRKVVSHGTMYGKAVEVPLGPAEFIVGATGRADQLLDYLVLTKRTVDGNLSSYECGSTSAGKYYDANVPAVPPSAQGHCNLRYTRGLCTIGGYDCTQMDDYTQTTPSTTSTVASTMRFNYYGFISTIQFVWSCYGLVDGGAMKLEDLDL